MKTLNFPEAGQLDSPHWFSGPNAAYRELHVLRQRIHQREAKVERSLRHLAMIAGGLLLCGSLAGQYAFASGAPGTHPAGLLLIALLPVFCGLIILGVHVLEMRFAEMGDDGNYAVCLQKLLPHVQLDTPPGNDDPVAQLIFKDARQLQAALQEHRPIHPAFIGEGLRLGH